MPAIAPLAPKIVEGLRKQYGTGPFGQLMMNLALAPPVGAPLFDLTGGPETWLKALENPIEPDPEMRLLHGLTSLPEKAIGKLGLNRGWFSKEPAEFFGPHYAETRFADLPQPVIAAPRASGMAKYDPAIEYSPAWAGEGVAEKELSRLKRELNPPSEFVKRLLRKEYPRGELSAIKNVQHEISIPRGAIIPPEKLTYVNPTTGERGPFADAFARLTKRMDPKEFQLFIANLKNMKFNPKLGPGGT